VTATAYKQDDEKGIKLFELADIKNLGSLNKLLALDNYWRARIEMFDINTSHSKPKNVYEYVNEKPAVSHLGNISEIEMDKRFEEKFNARLREIDYQKLQIENQELKSHIVELENDLQDAEEANTQLKEKVNSQQSMKNYAELAGTFLGKMGLKDKVSDILSGFFGDDEKKSDEKPSHLNDSSGIIEDFVVSNPQPAPEPKLKSETEPKSETESESVPISEPQPKNEYIELINLCLLGMDKPTLGITFAIFSKIEKNNALAQQILEMLYKNNSTESEKTQKSCQNDVLKNYFSTFRSFLCRKLETFWKILEKFRYNFRKS
jgi:FtsZ-binding cell division protein ZapB